MIRVAHIITGLKVGGAEMLLYRLLGALDSSRYESSVFSLMGRGPLAPKIEEIGVPVDGFQIKDLRRSVPDFLRLIAALRRMKPDVVQTWMYHADLIGGMAARLAGLKHLAWGIHTGPLPQGSVSVRLGLRAAAWGSRWIPERIVCCSEATMVIHGRVGYDRSKMLVISNGFEITDPIEDARRSVREELGIDSQAILIGRVGRDHPQKENRTAVIAARMVMDRHPPAHMVLVGEGLDPSNDELMDLANRARISDRVHLLGHREDVVRINSALDVAISSSAFGEGLPVVLGEAMAVGVPVVSTDVGDSARLINDPDRIVPPRDPHALADAICGLLDKDSDYRSGLGRRDSERVRQHFSLDAMVDQYARLYEELAS